MANQSLRIGVVGTGGWGKNHLRVFNEMEVLACLCDADPSRTSQWTAKYGCKGYLEVDKMLESEKLDAVTVCTPTTTHFEIASKVLKSGVNVFVEKPMTASSSEGERLVELAKDSGKFLTVGFIERFNSAVSEAKTAIKSRALGDPLLLEFHRENKWAGRITDVGIVADTSVHDIDTARWLFDEEPRVVFARVGNVLSEIREDFAAITLGFEGKKTAFLVSNWVTPKRLRQLSIVCTQGVITLDFITQEIRFDDAKGTVIPRRDFKEPLLAEMEAFTDALRNGRPPLVKPKDGLNNTIIAEAAIASSSTGTPIYLKL
ncbi:MAG TPA: Gfo/Idh/MocA family oxidoreductase [Nitrososphaerales archaeon]|nr:Gfo/Idh/MocA family oxidoreductase [Nitrososphaerales archaeon]